MPLLSPTIISTSPSLSKSAIAGKIPFTVSLSIVSKAIVERPPKSLSITSKLGSLRLPIFLSKASWEMGLLLLKYP